MARILLPFEHHDEYGGAGAEGPLHELSSAHVAAL
jgi:hypothetical protein